MQLTSGTKLLCLLAHPVGHSKSPQMQNAALASLSLNYTYMAFDVLPEHLRHAVEGLRALGVRGWNVSIPHKVAIIAYLDELAPEAQLIGAVNTVVNDNGKLIGHNTDGLGYIRSLREETGLDVSGKRVCILGAGGAARAIAIQLALSKSASVVVANRTLANAQALASEVGKFVSCEALSIDQAAEKDFDLIINTTSVGMYPNVDETPLPGSSFHESMVVSDIVYNPKETRFLREARERGARIHEGIGMFVYQGALAFELWTGIEAPVSLMRGIAEGKG